MNPEGLNGNKGEGENIQSQRDNKLLMYVEIGIDDTGCGIPEERLNHIFNPFFTTREEGTGLGLAITKRIIEAHGGNISVESRQGEGTKFRIRLPLRN